MKKRLIVLLTAAIMASSIAATAAGIPPPAIKRGNQCGEVTLKIGDREFKGALYPDIYPNGEVIIRISIPGYGENPWITSYDLTQEATSDIQKAAIAACGK